MNPVQSWGLALALLGLAIVVATPQLLSPDIVCDPNCAPYVDSDTAGMRIAATWAGLGLVVIGSSAIIWGGGRSDAASESTPVAG